MTMPSDEEILECTGGAPILMTEKDRLAMIRAALSKWGAQNAEWLCTSCNMIHPTQVKGKLVQPCPDCGEVMEPTSPNMREIARLRAELEAAREAIRQVFSAIDTGTFWRWKKLPAVRAAVEEEKRRRAVREEDEADFRKERAQRDDEEYEHDFEEEEP